MWKHVRAAAWSIIVGSVVLAVIFAIEGGFDGSIGSWLAVTALCLIAGGAVKLGRIFSARNDDQELAVLTAPKEARSQEMTVRRMSEIVTEQSQRHGAALRAAQDSGIRLL